MGSAPYVVDWWKQYRQWMEVAEVLVCPINCSWKVVWPTVHMWMHSNDFFKTGSELPTKNQRKELTEVESFLQKPFWYETAPKEVSSGGGTMILNVLYHLLNLLTQYDMVKARVGVIGCDLMYGGEQTHWYGKGTADPLRYGAEWLEGELKKLQVVVSRDTHADVVNLSTGESRLTFDRMTVEEFVR